MILSTKEKQGASFIPDELEQVSFTMKITDEAFQATVDNLYDDPVGSPPREYMANAFDAHRSIGSTEPFDVHVPTTWEPYFEVKDYGPGMDREEIIERFISLFSSSKTSTNDQVGFFGLGCKAAFTYTDSFELESRQNGKMTSYLLWRQNKSIPKMVTGETVDTDEPNGLTVRYNVLSADIPKFQEAIRQASLNYIDLDIVPNTHHSFTSLSDTAQWVMAKPGIYTMDTGVSYYSHNNVKLRMGAIAYPTTLKSPVAKEVMFDVPVGVFRPSTSRESLVLTPEEATRLEEFFQANVVDVLLEELMRDIAASDNPYQAFRKAEAAKYNGPYKFDTTEYQTYLQSKVFSDAEMPSGKYTWAKRNKYGSLTSVVHGNHFGEVLRRLHYNTHKSVLYCISPGGAFLKGMTPSFNEVSRNSNYGKENIIFVDSNEELEALKDYTGLDITFVEFKKVKASKQNKGSTPVDLYTLDSTGRRFEIEDIDEWLDNSPDFVWMTYSESQSYYVGGRTIADSALAQIIQRFDPYRDKPILIGTKTGVKKYLSPENLYIGDFMEGATASKIKTLIQESATKNFPLTDAFIIDLIRCSKHDSLGGLRQLFADYHASCGIRASYRPVDLARVYVYFNKGKVNV